MCGTKLQKIINIVNQLLVTSAIIGECSVPQLVEHPTDIVVARDEPATLRCEAKGVPEPDIAWIKDGAPVKTAPSDAASHRVLLPNGALFFLRAVQSRKEDDRGTYWCIASNSDGEAVSRKAKLDIAVLKTIFAEEPLDTWVIRGEEITLPCQPPVGHPEPEIEWKKNGEDVQMAPDDSRLRIESANLVIVNAQQSDEGRYQCVARNIAGVRHSHQALLSVYVKPFIIKAPENVSTDTGAHIKFSCVVGGDPAPEIKWIREDGKLTPSRTEVEDRDVLRIRSVTPIDSGKYVCQAENIAGEISASAFLQIQSPPVFLVEPQDKIVKLGEKVSIECKVESIQQAVLFWQKDGISTPFLPGTKQQHIFVDKSGNLLIESVSSRDEGWYGCFAVSETGSSSALAKLALKTGPPQPPPIIQLGPVNQTLTEGNVAILHCQFTSKDKARASWLKEGIPIEFSSNEHFHLTDGHNLQIKDIQIQDSGLYTCQIKTVTGQTSSSATITVLSNDMSEGNLPSIADLLAFPASPSKPKLVQSTTNSLTISWGKPHRVGNSPLRGYQVEYFTAGELNHWITSQVQGEEFMLENVTPGTSVIFLVRARNEHGLSPPSPLSDQLSTNGNQSNKGKKKSELLKQISDKLVELEEVTILGSKKVRLSWKVLAKSELIRGYHIHIQELTSEADDLNTITISGGGTRSHVLSHLRPNTEYRIFMMPYSNSGLSRPSNLKDFTTKEDAPDSYPSSVELKLLNSTAAVVQWRKPNTLSLNGELTGYKVEIFTNNTLVTNFTLEPSATSLLLNNLTTGVIYTVRLAAFNRAGMGPFSEPVSLKVEPSLLYQHPVIYPEVPIHSSNQVFQQTWFVSTVGMLSILLILSLAGFVYAKRKQVKDKHFGHYNVPVCKVDDSSNMNYLESDTLWINPKANGIPHTNTYQDKNSHLYINNMCPPEYAELDGKSTFRNINHTQGPCYASTNIMEKPFHKFDDINVVQTMNTSKPVPFTSDKSSSEDHSGNQMTGETTSGSSGQNTDTSTTDREKGQSGNTGINGDLPSNRKRRSKRSQSRHSNSNSGSDSSCNKTLNPGETSLPRQSDKGPMVSSEPLMRDDLVAVRHRLATSVGNSPYKGYGHLTNDPGLPPMPPMRGPSSYNGVRAGSFNSFGVTHYDHDSKHDRHLPLSEIHNSHYSVPGLIYGHQTTACHCCEGRHQCNQGHYESASIYKDGLYLPYQQQDQNKMFFNEDGSSIKVNCDICKSSVCICKDMDYNSYLSGDSSDSESFYADSDFEDNVSSSNDKEFKKCSHDHQNMTTSLYNSDLIGGIDQKSCSRKRMLKKSLNSITQWQDRDTEPTYSSFKPKMNDIFPEGSLPMKTKNKPRMHKKHKRRMSDGGKPKLKNMPSHNRASQSATSSPALSRKSSSANTKVSEDKGESESSLIYDTDKSAILSSYSNKVSDDINEMVEQIQAIQNDISELAGRPISLIGSKR